MFVHLDFQCENRASRTYFWIIGYTKVTGELGVLGQVLGKRILALTETIPDYKAYLNINSNI